VIKSRGMRWARHVACMGKGGGVYGILVGRPKGKRSLGRPRQGQTGFSWLRMGSSGWLL